MNPDKPFILRGGKTQQVAMYNRIACLKRVEHLTGVDLSRKSVWYRYALDLEMYQRWYKNEPKNKPIDEEFCQRMAKVIKEMEKDAIDYDNVSEMSGKVASAYNEYKHLPETSDSEDNHINAKKPGILANLINKLKGGKDG